MKTYRKIVMLTVLTMGLSVHEATVLGNTPETTVSPTSADIKAQIHKAIEEEIAIFKASKNKDSVKFLVAVQHKLKIILQHAPDHEYGALKKAVHELSPAKIATLLANIKIILSHIDPATKSLILQNMPQEFKIFIS